VRAFGILVLVCVAVAGEDSRDYTTVAGLTRGNSVLWHDPGPVERRDLRYGAGGRALAPHPPFRFVKEDASGSTPKVRVRDAAGREWVVKFGEEAAPDTFGSHLAWALGYYTEVNHFIRRGTIHDLAPLERAQKFIQPGGTFTGARFQLRAKKPEYLAGVSWSWDGNPFVGTPQLNGLKILMMLVSNWDDKDIRDAHRRGTNTSIYKDDGRFLFFVDDWGASMGHWGSRRDYLARSKWDAVDYYRESEKFVRGVKDGYVDWGYKGTHTDRIADDIRASDVRWLMRYLGRVTDSQLYSGLLASGATPDEAGVFTKALRNRIRQLSDVAGLRRSLMAGAR
jgi:hypothetical protein